MKESGMMTADFEGSLRRYAYGKRRSDIRHTAGICVAAMALLVLPGAAFAMPQPAVPAVGRGLPVVDVLTKCDTRGCFTFGPRQSYSRPTMQPTDQTGPRYYRPDAAGPPRFIPRQQTPAKRPQAARPLLVDPSLHRQRCLERYRSYDPRTDSYVGPGNRPTRCLLR